MARYIKLSRTYYSRRICYPKNDWWTIANYPYQVILGNIYLDIKAHHHRESKQAKCRISFIYPSFKIMRILLFTLILFVYKSIAAISPPTTHLADEIKYNRFNSISNTNYSVRFVNPQLCDPNVTQVIKLNLTFEIQTINLYCNSTPDIWRWDPKSTFFGSLKVKVSQRRNHWLFG